MEQTILDDPNPNPQPQGRPTFLTVLCILTFIGVGLSVVVQLIAYAALEATRTIFENSGEITKDLESVTDSLSGNSGVNTSDTMTELDSAITDANAVFKYAELLMLVGIAGALLCLFGAILMWKLKKTGFYIYTLGQVVPVAVSLILLGGVTFSAGIFSMIGPFIVIAFIVMYALNLRYMNK